MFNKYKNGNIRKIQIWVEVQNINTHHCMFTMVMLYNTTFTCNVRLYYIIALHCSLLLLTVLKDTNAR